VIGSDEKPAETRRDSPVLIKGRPKGCFGSADRQENTSQGRRELRGAYHGAVVIWGTLCCMAVRFDPPEPPNALIRWLS